MKLLRVLPLLLAVCLLAGCGGSGSGDNGVADKSADEILAEASTAVGEATSVHVQGSGASGGTPLEIDLQLVADEGGAGTLVANGLSFEMVRIGDKAYFKGDDDFWRQFGGDAAVALLRGRWLEAPATSGDFASFTPLTDIKQLFDAVLSEHGELEKGEETTIGDQPAIAIEDTSKGGTLYIATTGAPYPLQIKGGSDSPGTITFGEWDEPVDLAAPEDTIDISELQS